MLARDQPIRAKATRPPTTPPAIAPAEDPPLLAGTGIAGAGAGGAGGAGFGGLGPRLIPLAVTPGSKKNMSGYLACRFSRQEFDRGAFLLYMQRSS